MPKREPPPLLEFKNITVINGDKKVLDSLSVTIREGENIAILGPNGAGKSSFIQPTIRSKNQIPTIIIQPKDLCTMSLKRKICP